MKIAVLYGSVREARQGIKAARFITSKLKGRGHDATLIDPLEYPLPFLDKRYREYVEGDAPPMMRKISEILDSADGFIMICGEYNHGIPPVLKNMLDHYGKEYQRKPAAIVSYSSGMFCGVRAMVHLRAVLGELGMAVCPSTLPVSKVQDSFDESGKALDEVYERRAKKFLDEFEWYVRALKAAREINSLPR
jgi:NAD(P)H-dependent FMN reductase